VSLNTLHPPKRKTYEDLMEKKPTKNGGLKIGGMHGEGRESQYLGAVGDCDTTDNPNSTKTDTLRPGVFQ